MGHFHYDSSITQYFLKYSEDFNHTMNRDSKTFGGWTRWSVKSLFQLNLFLDSVKLQVFYTHFCEIPERGAWNKTINNHFK